MRVFAFIAISTMRRSGYFTSVFELRPVGCSQASSRCSSSSSLARPNWSTDPLIVPSIDSCPAERGCDSFLCGCAIVVHLCLHPDLLAQLLGPRAPKALDRLSGVFSAAAHGFLQYLPDVVKHEHLRHWEKALP